MNKPECLHIPTLHEGKNAEISWGATGADTSYIVERVFNETFSQALSGYTWGNIDTLGEPWSRYDQEALNWNQIETRAGKGRNWERHDYEQLSWSQIEANSLSWKQLECQDTNYEIFRGTGLEKIGIEQGCTWFECDNLQKSWESLELNQKSWDEWELMTLPGLSWDNIDARWLTFDEWEGKGLSFHDLDTQRSVESHRGMADFVPIGAKNAMYRIKASDLEGRESDYLTTLQRPVIPVFYRDCIMEYPVEAGKRYLILIKAQDIVGLDKVRMNLRYNQDLLRLTNFAANGQKCVTEAGNYPEEHLRIYSSNPGKVWFQSTKELDGDKCFSGSITLLEFVARETGIAKVSLS